MTSMESMAGVETYETICLSTGTAKVQIYWVESNLELYINYN